MIRRIGMKKFLTPLTLTLMIFFLTAPYAHAATGLYVGAGGSYAVENFDDDNDFDNINYDNSWGINVKVGYHLHELLDLEFNYDYLNKFEVDDSSTVAGTRFDVDIDVEVMTYMFTLKGFFPIASEKVKLSVIAGGGLMYADADRKVRFAGNSTSSSDDEIDGCAKFGLGFDYFIIQNFSAGIEGNYTLGFGDLDEIRYFNFTLGVAYHF
jgi:outer membrane protein W